MSALINATATNPDGTPAITARRVEPVGRHRFTPGVTPAQWHAAYLVKSRKRVAR